MAIIQQIGSYAGLAAVVGLAVLAALYFSQARDVKRLREWAGRAPDRAPGAYQQPYRPVAQPVRQPAPRQPPLPPGAGAQSAPVQAAAAGAAPAVAAGPLAATPAAARAADSAAAAAQSTVAPRAPRQTLPPRATPPGLGGHFVREAEIARAKEEAERVDGEPAPEQHADELGEEDRPDEGEPLEGQRLEGADSGEEHLESARTGPVSEEEELGGEEDEHDGEAEYDEEAEYDQESDPDAAALPDPEDFHEGDELVEDPVVRERRSVATPVRPPPPPITATRRPLPPRPAPPPRTGQAPLLPPYEESRPGGGTWETRKLSRPKAALAVGGTAAVVAAAFGVLQLTNDEKGPPQPAKSKAPTGANQPASEKKSPGAAAIDPGSVTVSVLNGTTVGGLAAQFGDKLERQGFQLGNVTNNTDQQRAESVVLFAPGAEREAKEVGRRLKIDQREPIDPDSQTRAGDATVVVVTGADLNR